MNRRDIHPQIGSALVIAKDSTVIIQNHVNLAIWFGYTMTAPSTVYKNPTSKLASLVAQ